MLIVAGDITEAALRPKLESALKSWKSSASPSASCRRRRAATRTKVYLIDKGDAPQSSIRVGLVGIERTNPDYIPVTVMNLILGGGFYRLDLNLREGKGWTYGARSTFDARRTPGPFSAGGEFVATHTADSVAEILKEVNTIRDTDVSDAELSRAKDQIIKSFPARFATRASTVGPAGGPGDLRVAGQLPQGLHEEDRGRSPRKTCTRWRRKYLTSDKLSIVVVGDQKSLKDGCRRSRRWSCATWKATCCQCPWRARAVRRAAAKASPRKGQRSNVDLDVDDSGPDRSTTRSRSTSTSRSTS